jgi:fatty-acyl-CoA synthase
MYVKTVVEALERASEITSRGFTFLDGSMNPDAYSFARLHEEARRRGRQLMALGAKKGDRVGIIVPDNDQFVLSFLGAVSVGIVPVPMYPPLALGKLDAYVASAASILGTAGAKLVVTTKKVQPILGSLLSKVSGLEKIVTVERLADLAPSDAPLPEITPEDTCFLQFTSGSTSEPKGVDVTHGNLIANAHAIMIDGLNSTPEDIGVSWLPLYHDMGLIGFVIAPIYQTVAVTFIPTLSFVKKPTLWLDTVARVRGTITFAPNFAFALAAKRGAVQVGREDFDLSCLRVVGCGAEPINPVTIRNFCETFGPAGLKPEIIMPCYGMAEATLAMSFEPLDEILVTQRIDRDAYENDNAARPAEGEAAAIEVVACGRTFPGHGLGVMGPDGALLPDGAVGELVFRGPSVARGYYQNPQATAETIRDGWLHTGDLGFILDGRVYVSGRMKDLIILNGRNYYPQAIEWEVEQVSEVRKGNVVCFAERGESTERLVVVAESKTEDAPALVERVKAAVRDALGLKVDDVVIVGPGALPKTSSGKLQRRKTRAQYRDGSLGAEGVRTMGKNATRATLAKHVASSFYAQVRHRVKKVVPRTALDLAAQVRDRSRKTP